VRNACPNIQRNTRATRAKDVQRPRRIRDPAPGYLPPSLRRSDAAIWFTRLGSAGRFYRLNAAPQRFVYPQQLAGNSPHIACHSRQRAASPRAHHSLRWHSSCMDTDTARYCWRVYYARTVPCYHPAALYFTASPHTYPLTTSPHVDFAVLRSALSTTTLSHILLPTTLAANFCAYHFATAHSTRRHPGSFCLPLGAHARRMDDAVVLMPAYTTFLSWTHDMRHLRVEHLRAA